MTDAVRAYLALGSNLGDRKQHLVDALRRLAPEAEVQAVSSLYETDPVGPQDQDDYYNAVCHVTTSLSPVELLAHVKGIEDEIGRTSRERWGPREIDIDVLLYGDSVVDEAGLRVPHPEMLKRAFVLVPLAEIAPGVAHPEANATIAELAGRVDAAGVRPLAGAGWAD